jgi:hypothetical protein
MELYEMELHDIIKFTKHLIVIRVPGGWIYNRIADNAENISISSVFVPFNDEFYSYITEKVKPDNF